MGHDLWGMIVDQENIVLVFMEIKIYWEITI